jgi:hypothetical protein
MYKLIIAGSRHLGFELVSGQWAMTPESLKFGAALVRTTVGNLISAKGIYDAEIISGGAMGADWLGAEYSRKVLEREPIIVPGDWETLGKKAGAIRNTEMAQMADGCIILWDGKSPGSKDMYKKAVKFNLDTLLLNYGKEPPKVTYRSHQLSLRL